MASASSGNLGGSKFPAHVFKVTEDAGERPPNLSQPEVRGHLDVVPSAAFALAERLDVGLEANVLGGGLGGVVKWQLTGGGLTRPEAESVPVALHVRAGRGRGNNKGAGDDGLEWSGHVESTYAQAGVSVGYRPNDLLLFYGGISAGQYRLTTEITQSPRAEIRAEHINKSIRAMERPPGRECSSAGEWFNFLWPGNTLG
ncbi:MAG: hypothetical protein HC902_05805 [Calothrix sp. SM1_5_4]|nr:hypothetical protein [Calothrix sp. SM1_5_4]